MELIDSDEVWVVVVARSEVVADVDVKGRVEVAVEVAESDDMAVKVVVIEVVNNRLVAIEVVFNSGGTVLVALGKLLNEVRPIEVEGIVKLSEVVVMLKVMLGLAVVVMLP